MDHTLLIVVLVVVLALFFDFTNGFHDTANAMATPIATGAMKPKVAVTVAAILNLVGAFLSTEVAKTVSGGILTAEGPGSGVPTQIILAGLVGAIAWNMITWLFGLPSSSSHALFGGLIGAAIVGAGFASVNYWVLLDKVVLPALLAPVIAGLVAFTATKLAYVITRRYDGLPDGRAGFRYGQIFSSSLVALSHGTNDAQKTMGVITLALIAGGYQSQSAPIEWWVIAACALAIAAGTYTGGWRIIDTLGKGLTEVKPAQGFASEVSTGAAILASSHLGFALSTTQVASGSVIGSGLGRRGSRVRWKTARRIALGWLLTLPAAAIVGAVAALVAVLGTVGVVIDVAIAVALIVTIFVVSGRQRAGAAQMKPTAIAKGVSDVAKSSRVVKIRKVKPKRPKRPKKSEVAAGPGKKKPKKKGKGKTKKGGKNKGKGGKGKKYTQVKGKKGNA
ncbi:inorganic phosphate transporter [Microbacterium sp. STN6]|uniref:inorganic phosphate transporter n=1 Tax=Microbacterium sp. STN6 TaxID=2995588 RepID=UPI0022609C26|nr:inorganic phosphate transporter [Microbacterium sp. STN6]MCX7521258.1 inorganic phosphate transporter [Microbacterium sp. STN6]